MMSVRLPYRPALFVIAGMLALPVPALAQDGLARAKDYYATANYEEALQALTDLRGKGAATEATQVAAYQVFCLVALGRSDEAKGTIENLVRVDPLYHPSDSEVSPRVRTFFETVRRPLLPDVARQSYAKAKDAFDRKEMSVAAAEFDRVMALVDEIGMTDPKSVSDLRTLASGFRDLSKAAVAAAAPPPPPPAPAKPEPATPGAGEANRAAPAPAPVSNRVYSADDPDVVKPTAIARPLPAWNPANPVDAKREFRGVLEVSIDELGRITQATIRKSVNPTYDAALLRAIEKWSFRPATKDGQPVKYLYSLDIHLGVAAR
jgi:TonB family protein